MPPSPGGAAIASGSVTPEDLVEQRVQVAREADGHRGRADRELEHEVPADDERDELAERRVRVRVRAAGGRDHRRELGVAERGQPADHRRRARTRAMIAGPARSRRPPRPARRCRRRRSTPMPRTSTSSAPRSRRSREPSTSVACSVSSMVLRGPSRRLPWPGARTPKRARRTARLQAELARVLALVVRARVEHLGDVRRASRGTGSRRRCMPGSRAIHLSTLPVPAL